MIRHIETTDRLCEEASLSKDNRHTHKKITQPPLRKTSPKQEIPGCGHRHGRSAGQSQKASTGGGRDEGQAITLHEK
ncbi:unnamed protein product [Pleuronectes platessa]|uniref:Uncharacterized protein n=1 Tax=Pleuronectes platessa TaxID=8262 RepID=A0A9N7UEJ1_PLEPL|nr:unnamed protein product [Pleuronectes platessa]